MAYDNVGTLQQKIRDAFVLVNKNGEAFRGARITQDYLDARLAELKWASATVALREQDKAEQRALREKIREEERAQREYEKAMKEAAKEEEIVKKAMERAQREMEKAKGDDKARYEAQLLELEIKLRAAEAKNQKALSMAQMTKAGHVYIISNVGSFGEDVFKIGLTRRLEPLDRIKELGDASVPFEFDVHALIKSDDAPSLEFALHKRFVKSQVNKVNPRKEFFRLALAEIRSGIEAAGCQVQWTMTAAARSYKETIAIEKAMKDEKFDEASWLKEQLREPAAFSLADQNDDEDTAVANENPAGRKGAMAEEGA